MLEYVTLYNLLGMHQKAYDTIMNHRFRAWEGAEGRISGQYKIALTEMAKEEIVKKNFKAVAAGIVSGVLASLVSVLVLAKLFGLSMSSM